MSESETKRTKVSPGDAGMTKTNESGTKKVKDPELEAVVQRAMKLRITMTELCEFTGVYRYTLYRWRYEVSPHWDERQAFIDNAERMISARLAEYMGS